MQHILFTQNNNNINFSGRLPTKQYNDFRHIPGMRCAKCHEKMLGTPERDEFLNKCQKGANQQFKSDIFKNIQNNAILEFFRNLAKKNPKVPFTELVKKEEIQQQISKFQENEQEEITDILNATKTVFKNSKQIIKKLKPLPEKHPQMPQKEKEVIKLMEYYSIKYPNETFYDIFRKPEVIQIHKQKAEFEDQKFYTIFNKKFNEFTKLQELLQEKEKKRFKNTLKYTNQVCKTSFYPASTKNMLLEKQYHNLLEDMKDKKVAEKIRKKLFELPQKEATADHIIYHASQKNISDKEFVMNIINTVTSTFEHIILDSQNGSKTIDNGLYFCKACNTERANLPYGLVAKNSSDFFGNIKSQVNTIISLVKHGNLPKYKDAPMGIKKALRNETGGELNLDIKKYVQYRSNEINTNYQNIKSEVGQSNTKLAEQNQEIKDITQEIKDITQDIKDLKAKLDKLRRDHSKEQKHFQILSKQLGEAKQQKKEFDIYKKKENSNF